MSDFIKAGFPFSLPTRWTCWNPTKTWAQDVVSSLWEGTNEIWQRKVKWKVMEWCRLHQDDSCRNSWRVNSKGWCSKDEPCSDVNIKPMAGDEDGSLCQWMVPESSPPGLFWCECSVFLLSGPELTQAQSRNVTLLYALIEMKCHTWGMLGTLYSESKVARGHLKCLLSCSCRAASLHTNKCY